MEFEQFISKIDHIKSSPLAGIEAHKALAPLNRPTFKEYNIPENAKKAAVLILFYPDNNQKTCVLLTKRASYKGTHSSQISFPGGKKEAQDIDLKATALRESNEEVGVYNVEVLKQMTAIYIPPSNFKVIPYFGVLKTRPNFQPNYEVEEIIEFPIETLLTANTLTSFTSKANFTANSTVPCFRFNNHNIWGATAMMLNETKELLKTLF